MDAIDTSYQSIPNLQENKSVETKDKTEEDFVVEGELAASELTECSFEDLMDCVFDKVIEKKEVKEESSVGVDFLSVDVVDEDVNSMIALLSKEDIKVSQKDEISKTIKPFVEGEEKVTYEVPFVEIEVDIAPLEKTEKKETKSVKDKKDVKTEEKDKKKGSDLVVKDDKLNIENSPLIKQKKIENVQKPNKKEEIKKEEIVLEDVVSPSVQKTNKPKLKKLPITVQDLRTQDESNLAQAGVEDRGSDASSEDFSSHYRDEHLNDVKGAKEASGNSDVQNTKGQMSFSSILAEQIKSSSAEIVERGRILLKDGNVGEIRLQLKPEHLGSVRIELKLSGDKKMQGEVTVSSQDAYDAFEDSLGELVAAFEDAGFDTSGFNLNWQNRGNEEVVREDLTNQYFSPEKTHQSLSEKLNLTENIYGFGQAENLNILA